MNVKHCAHECFSFIRCYARYTSFSASPLVIVVIVVIVIVIVAIVIVAVIIYANVHHILLETILSDILQTT